MREEICSTTEEISRILFRIQLNQNNNVVMTEQIMKIGFLTKIYLEVSNWKIEVNHGQLEIFNVSTTDKTASD